MAGRISKPRHPIQRDINNKMAPVEIDRFIDRPWIPFAAVLNKSKRFLLIYLLAGFKISNLTDLNLSPSI